MAIARIRAGAAVSRVPTRLGEPWALTVLEDGRLVFVSSQHAPEADQGEDRALFDAVVTAERSVAMEGTLTLASTLWRQRISHALSPDGGRVVRAVGKRFAMFDANTGKQLLAGPTRTDGDYLAASFSRDGSRLALTTLDRLFVFRAADLTLETELPVEIPATSPSIHFTTDGSAHRLWWQPIPTTMRIEPPIVGFDPTELRYREGTRKVCYLLDLQFQYLVKVLIRTRDGARVELDLEGEVLSARDADLERFLAGGDP